MLGILQGALKSTAKNTVIFQSVLFLIWSDWLCLESGRGRETAYTSLKCRAPYAVSA